jgi:hypothetical protein
VPGSPIRKSPDQSLVADSPRHIAGSHVLHRLLMPRHPPCALKNFEHTNPDTPTSRAPRRSLQLTREPTQKKLGQISLIRMLASTVQFSKNRQPPHPTQPSRPCEQKPCATPETPGNTTPLPPAPQPSPTKGKNQGNEVRGRWPVSSGPNSVPAQTAPRVHRSHSPPAKAGRVVLAEARHPRNE